MLNNKAIPMASSMNNAFLIVFHESLFEMMKVKKAFLCDVGKRLKRMLVARMTVNTTFISAFDH